MDYFDFLIVSLAKENDWIVLKTDKKTAGSVESEWQLELFTGASNLSRWSQSAEARTLGARHASPKNDPDGHRHTQRSFEELFGGQHTEKIAAY